jgi:hypothetical protein
MSKTGKMRLGVILNYTQMDIENPTLREWCLLVIRNITSWSEQIRLSLKALELLEVSPEGKQTL